MNSARSFEEFLLRQGNYYVPHRDMRLLYTRRIIGWHKEGDINHCRQLSASAAKEPYSCDPDLPGSFCGIDHVSRIARCRYREEDIFLGSHGFQLARENFIEAVIVGAGS